MSNDIVRYTDTPSVARHALIDDLQAEDAQRQQLIENLRDEREKLTQALCALVVERDKLKVERDGAIALLESIRLGSCKFLSPGGIKVSGESRTHVRVELIGGVDVVDDYGEGGVGTVARCLKCEHKTRSFGTHEASRTRCMVQMRRECPLHEDNFYVDKDADG